MYKNCLKLLAAGSAFLATAPASAAIYQYGVIYGSANAPASITIDTKTQTASWVSSDNRTNLTFGSTAFKAFKGGLTGLSVILKDISGTSRGRTLVFDAKRTYSFSLKDGVFKLAATGYKDGYNTVSPWASSATVVSVPEPGSLALLGLGVGGLFLSRLRRKKAQSEKSTIALRFA